MPLSEKLQSSLQQWEAAHGSPFTWEGAPFVEELTSFMEQYRVEEEEVAKKKVYRYGVSQSTSGKPPMTPRSTRTPSKSSNPEKTPLTPRTLNKVHTSGAT